MVRRSVTRFVAPPRQVITAADTPALLASFHPVYLAWLPHRACIGAPFPLPLLRQPAGGGYDQREDCQDMPRPYEAVYVFDSTLEDSAVTEKLDRFHQLLGTTGELKLDHWGRRQLAYPIGPRENGYYVVARFDAESGGIPEYERALKLDGSVIRYLLTIHEDEVGAPPMSEEELALAKKRGDDDDEDEE